VVRVLNAMRSLWDPDDEYSRYHFLRQSQTHPDVLLRPAGSGEDREILMGIELKGWYLLAKEGVPSLRFTATRAACASQDLVVVVPWALSNVISGTPVVFPPWIEQARYCADMRNYYWQVLRLRSNPDANPDIRIATGAEPYPVKSDEIADKPASDSGRNFGRLARTGVMDEHIARALDTPLCGIAVRFWQEFLNAFKEHADADAICAAMARLKKRIAPHDRRRAALEAVVRGLLDLIGEED